MPDKSHGHDLRDACGVQHGGHAGAQRVEGLAMPCAAVPPCVAPDKADSVASHEVGEFA